MRAATLVWLVLGLALLGAGCAGPAVAPSGSPPADVAPQSTPTPTPIPAASGPASSDSAVRAAAAKAYLAAARAYNATKRALAPLAIRNFEQTRTYYLGLAKTEHAFLVAIRKVDFPADVGPRVDLLLKLTAESEAWELKGSAAKSRTDLDWIEPSILRADQAASLAADLLRKDLGLPSIYL